MVQRSEQELVRRAKLEKIREKRYPFPNDVQISARAADVTAAEPGEPATAQRFTIAGRIVQLRLMGKAAFAHILDASGRVQVYLKSDQIGADSFDEFKTIDIGDIISCSGYAFITKTGEKSLHVETWKLLTKSLIPLPEKWHGLTDIESRYRYRYVDLIANPEVRDTFRKRALIISGVRNFLNQRGYLEVETPILNAVASGATAKPFETHHNTLGCDMVMRIALELPLKKLVVGGFERVYEIGRNFRNEGISKKHNPEFTMLEFYQAYATFEDLMTLTEELIGELVRQLNDSLTLQYGDNQIDFTGPWKRISMKDSVTEIGGVDPKFDLDTLQGVVEAAKVHRIHLEEPGDWGRSLEALWGELVEPKLINPTFITHHPFSISPLARQNAADPKVTDRFELVVGGMELANAFSELNDPIDQRERFEAQAKRRESGDEEAPEVDEDFLRALEYGMPPTAGEGIGIDRLVMLLTNSPSIRDVVLFPQLKPLPAGEIAEEENPVSESEAGNAS